MIGRFLLLAAALALPACSKNTPNEVQANSMGPGMMANDTMGDNMMANGMCEGANCNGDMNGMMGNGMMANGMMENRSTTSGMPVPGTNTAEHVVHHDNSAANNE